MERGALFGWKQLLGLGFHFVVVIVVFQIPFQSICSPDILFMLFGSGEAVAL